MSPFPLRSHWWPGLPIRLPSRAGQGLHLPLVRHRVGRGAQAGLGQPLLEPLLEHGESLCGLGMGEARRGRGTGRGARDGRGGTSEMADGVKEKRPLRPRKKVENRRLIYIHGPFVPLPISHLFLLGVLLLEGELDGRGDGCRRLVLGLDGGRAVGESRLEHLKGILQGQLQRVTSLSISH